MFYAMQVPSPLGRLTLASDEERIIGLWMEGQKYYPTDLVGTFVRKNDLPVLCAGKEWLEDYFAGKRPEIVRLPLAPMGSPFRQEVWKLLTEIPYGEVTTYGALAAEIAGRRNQSRMSAQAIGGAVGHNPISILIPCHRVVGANGSLTGYAGGIRKKRYLLEHEGVDMKNRFTPKNGAAL